MAFTEHKEIDGKIVEKQIPRDYKMKETYDIFELNCEFTGDKKNLMRFRKQLGNVFSNWLVGNQAGIRFTADSTMRVHRIILELR